MDNNEQNVNAARPGEENSLNLLDIWNMVWDYKWWYVLSVAACLALALLYIYVTPKTYQRVAKVIINEESGSNVMSDLLTMAGGAGSGAGSYSSNANNEAEAFASPDLMEKVVRRLSLETSYTERQPLRKVELYRSSPVEMSLVDTLVSSYFSFRLVRTGEESFLLKDFVIGPDKVRGTEVEGVLSQPVPTPAGTIRIDPSINIGEWDNDIDVSWARPMSRAKIYSSNLVVTVTGKNSTVLSLSMTDRFIPRAERILNTLIDVYNEEWVTDKSRSARKTSQFISERIQVIEKELSGIETDLKEYKEKNNLTDIKAVGQAYLEELGKFQAKDFEVRNQLSIAGYIRDYLNDPKNALSLLPANSGLSDTGVETQISEYNKLFLQRETLISNSSENNPLIADLTLSLDAIRASVLRSVENMIGTLELQVAQIAGEEAKLLSSMSSSSGQEMELLSIERQQQVKQSLYLYLLQKREENDIASLMDVANTRLIVTPNGSMSAISPNTMLIMLAALVLGSGIPFGIILLIHGVDNTIKTREDVASLPAPFLAEIPAMKTGRRHRKTADTERIVVQRDNRDMMNEAFRVLRTNFDFMMGRGTEGKPKVVLFSSFSPGSGKSFISINLAATLSLKGSSVVVLDLDLRKGTLGKRLKISNAGLSMYLSGNEDSVDKITVKIAENLYAIPAGILPPNPAELLLSERFGKLIGQLREKYDYVFLDCPPIDIVADTAIIASAADLTVFILRSGLTDRRALPQVKEIIDSGVYPRMAIILNGTEHNMRRYGYGRYGYGHES